MSSDEPELPGKRDEPGDPGETDAPVALSWTQFFATSARLNMARPLSTLLLLSLFVTLVSGSLAEATEAAFFLSFVLLAIETYVDIAAILAASDLDPDPAGDTWLREAFRRRVFWRYLLTSIAVYFTTGLAFALLLVPGFIVAGRFGLAQATAVLDARRETLPIARSVELTKPARRTISVLFGVFLVLPALGLQIAAILAVEVNALFVALNMALVITARIATVALVRAYLVLGGVKRGRAPRA